MLLASALPNLQPQQQTTSLKRRNKRKLLEPRRKICKLQDEMEEEEDHVEESTSNVKSTNEEIDFKISQLKQPLSLSECRLNPTPTKTAATFDGVGSVVSPKLTNLSQTSQIGKLKRQRLNSAGSCEDDSSYSSSCCSSSSVSSSPHQNVTFLTSTFINPHSRSPSPKLGESLPSTFTSPSVVARSAGSVRSSDISSNNSNNSRSAKDVFRPWGFTTSNDEKSIVPQHESKSDSSVPIPASSTQKVDGTSNLLTQITLLSRLLQQNATPTVPVTPTPSLFSNLLTSLLISQKQQLPVEDTQKKDDEECDDQPLSLVKHNRQTEVLTKKVQLIATPEASPSNVVRSRSAKTSISPNSNTAGHNKSSSRERRVEANARERNRVHNITSAYDRLQNFLPNLSELSEASSACQSPNTSYVTSIVEAKDNRVANSEESGQTNNAKLSKLSVIRLASKYIKMLSRECGYDIDESSDDSPPNQPSKNLSTACNYTTMLRNESLLVGKKNKSSLMMFQHLKDETTDGSNEEFRDNAEQEDDEESIIVDE